ncbi:hypothetical protein MBOT_06080 [Mycobacterium botniense]|uniref:Uncharacterized protein n=1 Tax=Mycobacterium botniense TaxID=84962 RepID=A0A7I9XTB7_9MYCO|nr:hypothetical protein MBOT_06080 [Mycobacterium botniense]
MEFAPGSVLEVRTALSSVSVEGARANLAAEGGAGFDAVRAAASSAWHAALSRSRGGCPWRPGEDVLHRAVAFAVASQHVSRRRRPLSGVRRHTAFDRTEIALPAGTSIRVFAPGASNGLTYINGLSVDGKPIDQTFLPESILRAGGDLMLSLSATPPRGGAQPCRPRRHRSIR